jgi:hypothetical protein
MEWNNVFVDCCVILHLVSYKNELVSQFQKHLQNVPFPCFCGDKEDLLHVTHCIISLLPYEKIHLYQGYFNLLCH